MKNRINKEYTINDLPLFSPWPVRLLGLEPWAQKYKTKEELVREYEHEKWGSLLSKVQSEIDNVSLDRVEKWMIYDSPDVLCSIQNKLKLVSSYEAHQKYINLIEKTLKQFLPASSIVELGCGYGSIIIHLAKNMSHRSIPFLAAEYTKSGKFLTGILSKADKLSLALGHCDFTAKELTELSIPDNAIIFTSYATHCIPKLKVHFIEELIKFNPKVVIHFEPCYEHCNTDTLLGLMRKRYIEMNDYNTNLVTLIHSYEQRQKIKIVSEKPTVFGKNPLFAASIIAWAIL